MRAFLLAIGWLSLFGSAADIAIVSFAIILALGGEANWAISVGALFQDHISWLMWIKELAYVILPDALVDWIFELPAILYFSVRFVVSTFIGIWALRAADRHWA